MNLIIKELYLELIGSGKTPILPQPSTVE